ncbi:hypothetical protein CRG98_025301 [Punica granatum]|uniref:Uncharacterized protein n=1 Tax=Punica granatum TaxID=22663 RepID=A0A2I0JEF5_PUNGR|nr:hypothetical protein CRG98_025301 [Punica granatum]
MDSGYPRGSGRGSFKKTESARRFRPQHGARRGVGAAGLGGFSRGLGRLGRGLGSSRGCGFEPWLGGLAWLSYGSHSIRRKAGKSSRLDWSHVCLPRSD